MILVWIGEGRKIRNPENKKSKAISKSTTPAIKLIFKLK